MRFLLLVLLATPLLAQNAEEDLAYTKKKLRAYNERISHRQNESVTSSDQDPNEPVQHVTLLDNQNQVDHEKSISKVKAGNTDTDSFFDGDIILTREQVDALFGEADTDRQKRQAMNIKDGPYFLWGRNISYVYEANYPEEWKKVIKYAADLYSRLTCLKIGEYGRQDNYLTIVNGSCLSSIGKVANGQALRMGITCQSIGISVHEFGHALGLWHTHARFDRDEYIDFVDKQGNAVKMDRKTIWQNDNLGIPYDYGSVMHYPAYGQYAGIIKPKDPNYHYTMGSHLDSFYDILALNKLYGCIDDCANSTTACTNSGYPNPNNCSICICPRGYGGQLCNEMPQDGVEIQFTTMNKVCKSGATVAAPVDDTKYAMKYYWIRNPQNKNLTITYKFASGTDDNLCRDSCSRGGLEIKSQQDQATTGYRFCCKNETVITTNVSLVPIIFYHRENIQTEYSFCAEIDDVLPATTKAQQPTTSTQTTTTVIPTTTPAECSTPAPLCKNGGIPNQYNCSECVCPSGFAGKLCDELPDGGSEVSIKTFAKECIFVIADILAEPANYTEDSNGFTTEYIWIRAEQGSKLKITLKDIASYNAAQGSICVPGCTKGGIEIKIDDDRAKEGQKYCCAEEVTIVSNQSLVPLILRFRKDALSGYGYCASIYTDEIVTSTLVVTSSTTATIQTTTTPTTSTTTKPADPGSCFDSEGRVKSNGETWREPTTNVEWQCHNGYPKVIKCWFQWSGEEKKVWFLDVSTNIKARCIENGMVPDESTEDKGSCTDHFGVVRKTDEQWEEPSTLVTWVCMKNGYPRVVSCTDLNAYAFGPVKREKCPVVSFDTKKSYFCEADGLNEVAPDYTAPGMEDGCD